MDKEIKEKILKNLFDLTAASIEKVERKDYLAPEKVDTEERYTQIMQGNVTNELTKVFPKQVSIFDEITGEGVIEKSNIKVFIDNYKEGGTQIKATTWQFLDFLLLCNPSKKLEKNIAIPLDEYMRIRGLKDKKSARATVKKEMALLSKIRLSFTAKGKNPKDNKNFINIGLVDTYGIKNSVIYFSFGEMFFEAIDLYFNVMPVPYELFKIDAYRNDTQYYLLRKFTEHKNLNYIKTNSNTLSIKTLLDICPSLPKYEDIYKAGRIQERIIQPFEDALDNIESFTWEYCKEKNEKLTDAELESFTSDFKKWETLNIRVYWKQYPQRELTDRQLNHLKKKKKKEETSKKVNEQVSKKDEF